MVFGKTKVARKKLASREYLCSDRFTLADICVSYAIYLATSLNVNEALKPNIARWSEKLFNRDAFKRATSQRFIEES